MNDFPTTQIMKSLGIVGNKGGYPVLMNTSTSMNNNSIRVTIKRQFWAVVK